MTKPLPEPTPEQAEYLARMAAALREADFKMILSTHPAAGATVAMTVPGDSSAWSPELRDTVVCFGHPPGIPSSISPLYDGRVRLFFEYGDAPVYGDLRRESVETTAE